MTPRTRAMISVGGAELCVETFGDDGAAAVLLMAGATSSMDWWEPELCDRLAAAGRFVIRYDHRDTGQSTTSPAGRPTYTGADLAADPLRILDALGIRAAHLVGVSMGGGIAQDLAVREPERVLSLTLVATTSAFERADSTTLPPPEPRVLATFEPSDVDWNDTEAVVDRMVEVQQAYAGSLGRDEHRLRTLARTVVERSTDLEASVTNHWVVSGGDEDERHTMAEIDVPTLVLHGTEDPFFPLAHGQALAAEIAGARLVVVEGMGHEVPPPEAWDVAVPAILQVTGS